MGNDKVVEIGDGYFMDVSYLVTPGDSYQDSDPTTDEG